jgi:hypothetical protein
LEAVVDTTGNALSGDERGPDVRQTRPRTGTNRWPASGPALLFGVLLVAYAVVAEFAGLLGDRGRHLTLLLYWPVTTGIAVAALWWAAQRRAARDGVAEVRSSAPIGTVRYLAWVIVTVVLAIPAIFIGVGLPLVWPAVVLAVIGARQHSRNLRALGAGLALVGVLEVVFVEVHGGPPRAWSWLPAAVAAISGLALIAAGMLIRRRDRAAS